MVCLVGGCVRTDATLLENMAEMWELDFWFEAREGKVLMKLGYVQKISLVNSNKTTYGAERDVMRAR